METRMPWCCFTPTVIVPLERDPDDYNFTVETTPGLPNSTKMTHWGLSGTAAYDVNDQLTLKSITGWPDSSPFATCFAGVACDVVA